MQKSKLKRPRCSKCNSTQIYRRIISKEIVCKTCGNVDKYEGEI